MLLIAGLGNPGPKYAGNRHNIGFMAADLLARRHNFSPWQKKFSAEICEGTLDGEKTVLIKPQTFMNNSGQSVGEAMRFYKLEPSSLIVIYDELDLIPGKLRVKTGGGSGGHNGIKSIDQHCGKDYRRVRLGIGHPGDKAQVLNHVLGDFAKSDKVWLDPFLDAVADAAPLLASKDENAFATRVALILGKDSDAPAPKPAAQSHNRQARPHKPEITIPETGPMAAMLKRLFGKE
ncbi:MAG: aminoacyl-tRNA hydrolase [Rhizobiaceae bacterium]